jgi:deoxyadenosine/deoxycytidine kinase
LAGSPFSSRSAEILPGRLLPAICAWSFHSQIFFSPGGFPHRQLCDHPTSVIQDRTVYEDAEVFARNLYLQGHISDRDWGTYQKPYQV